MTLDYALLRTPQTERRPVDQEQPAFEERLRHLGYAPLCDRARF
jgi:hypothetical protein